MREQEEWDLIKMAKNPDVTVRYARRDGKMHVLHATHRAGEDRAKGQGGRVQRRAFEGIGRHDSENGVPAGVSGAGDCFWRRERSEQQRFKIEGVAARLFRAGKSFDETSARRILRASAIRTR